MSNIRVTYSGFIAFGASILSSVSGLIYVVDKPTRKLYMKILNEFKKKW